MNIQNTSEPALPYYTLSISWEPDPEKRTQWHPTEPQGKFSTLTRGAFTTPQKAHEWAEKHIPGATYTVQMYGCGDTPIGFLKHKQGTKGWRVVGRCCATRDDQRHASKLYRINVIPYSQHCCECGISLVEGGSIRDLFDGT